MPSIALRNIRRVGSKIYFIFSDKSVYEFNSPAEARAWVRGVDADQAVDILRRLLLRWWLIQNPTGDTPALVEGKTITLDLSAPTLLRIE